MINKLRNLSAKMSLSNDDKRFIEETSAQYGLVFNHGCSNCYYDQIFVIYNLIKGDTVMKKEDEKKDVETTAIVSAENGDKKKENKKQKALSGSKYVYNYHTPIVVGGTLFVSELTLTDTIARKLISMGLGKYVKEA